MGTQHIINQIIFPQSDPIQKKFTHVEIVEGINKKERIYLINISICSLIKNDFGILADQARMPFFEKFN